MSASLAIYPGSFDPLTNRPRGHHPARIAAVRPDRDRRPDQLSRRRRSSRCPSGSTIAREVFRDRANVEVDTFDGLLVDYARRRQASVIVRGLRAVSDFEFEMQMALMNRRLNPEVETVFMMPAEPYTYVSSRLVKEVVALGGSVKGSCRTSSNAVAREEARAGDAEGLTHGKRTNNQPGGNVRGACHADRHVADHEGHRRGADAQGEGVDVVDFGAGEPDFPTPATSARPRTRRSTATSRSTRPTPAPTS